MNNKINFFKKYYLDISSSLNYVEDEDINCVLSEPQYNRGLVEAVLSGTDAKTGIIDPLGHNLEAGPNLYSDLIRNMAKSLAGCL